MLAQRHRQRALAVALVERRLVDVLSDEDGHHPEPVRHRHQERRRRQPPGNHIISASHHQGSPDDEGGDLPEAEAFQRPGRGVVQIEQRQPSQGETQGQGAANRPEVQHDPCADDREDSEAHQQAFPVEEPAGDGVDCVSHPGRVGRVVAPPVAEVIIAQVAERMGRHESDEHEDEGHRIEPAGARGQQPRNHGRLGGDNEDDAAGGEQKFRHGIEL